jgi:hypothetical protein
MRLFALFIFVFTFSAQAKGLYLQNSLEEKRERALAYACEGKKSARTPAQESPRRFKSSSSLK